MRQANFTNIRRISYLITEFIMKFTPLVFLCLSWSHATRPTNQHLICYIIHMILLERNNHFVLHLVQEGHWTVFKCTFSVISVFVYPNVLPSLVYQINEGYSRNMLYHWSCLYRHYSYNLYCHWVVVTAGNCHYIKNNPFQSSLLHDLN